MFVSLFVSCVVIFSTATTEAESPPRYFPGGPPGDLISPPDGTESCCHRLEEENRQILQELAEIKTLLKTAQHGGGQHPPPSDCYDVLKQGESASGVFTIQPNGSEPFSVFCDNSTVGGGWTVFQRRRDGSEEFERTWEEYENGFGDLENEFWLGNEKIYKLISQRPYQLLIDLADFDDNTRYAVYDLFQISDATDNYRLNIGEYSGDAGDAMAISNGQQFTTLDRDNDMYFSGKCTDLFRGAWWYNTCHEANLNGLYLRGSHTTYADGIEWMQWTGYYYSLKFTEMKIRPL